MKQLTSKDICLEKFTNGAILNEEFTGFKEDYLTLHCLLKSFSPKSFKSVDQISAKIEGKLMNKLIKKNNLSYLI